MKTFLKKSLLILPVLAVAAGTMALPACQPRTPSQKIEDKAEDAGHDIHQAGERASENVKDATK